MENNKICLDFPEQGWYSLRIAKIMASTGRYQSSEFCVDSLGENPECAIYEFPSRMEGTPFIFFLALLLLGPSVYISMWVNFVFSLLFLMVVYIFMSFLTKKKEAGLITSITFMISGLFLIYSLSHENMLSLFFIPLSLLFILLSFKVNKLHFYMLTFLIMAFAAKIRPEDTVIFVIFFILVFLFKKKFFKDRAFLKNISLSLVLALAIGISFVMHVMFIPMFWGIEFMGPEYEGIHPFMTGKFFENLTEHSYVWAQFNGWPVIMFLLIGAVYCALRYRKILLLFLLSMIPYALVYTFYAHGGYNYTYHLNFFLIPIAGMGVYLLLRVILMFTKRIAVKRNFILAVVFSIAIFFTLFPSAASRLDSCKIGTLEFLRGISEVSGEFEKDDIIVTGRDDFAGILDYSTESCVIYTAFTSDGIVIKEYEKAQWDIIVDFIKTHKNSVFYFMPKEDVTANYYYYEGMFRKLSQIFNLEKVYENDISIVYEISNKI